MKATTLKALKQSIAHWKRLATGKCKPGETIGHKSCALCRMFCRKKSGALACVGCPVFFRTGATLCRNTPYYSVCAELMLSGQQSEVFKEEARNELKFLQSLLPKRKPLCKNH